LGSINAMVLSPKVSYFIGIHIWLWCPANAFHSRKDNFYYNITKT